jgi:hypothetical protein
MEHVERRFKEIDSILVKHLGLSVKYFIEVGFNEELITRTSALLEEVHIIITSTPPAFLRKSSQKSKVMKELAPVLSPFPAYVENLEGDLVVKAPVLDVALQNDRAQTKRSAWELSSSPFETQESVIASAQLPEVAYPSDNIPSLSTKGPVGDPAQPQLNDGKQQETRNAEAGPSCTPCLRISDVDEDRNSSAFTSKIETAASTAVASPIIGVSLEDPELEFDVTSSVYLGEIDHEYDAAIATVRFSGNVKSKVINLAYLL